MTQPAASTAYESGYFAAGSVMLRSCACLNVSIRYRADSQHEAQDSDEGLLRKVRVQEKDVQIMHLNLTAREPVTLAWNEPSGTSAPPPAQSAAEPARLVSAIGLRCTLCASTVYCVEKAASSGPVRSVGFVADGADTLRIESNSVDIAKSRSPSRDRDRDRQRSALSAAATISPLRPADGWVWLLPGCSLDRAGIERAKRSEKYSETFQVLINSAAIDRRLRDAGLPPATSSYSRFASAIPASVGKGKGAASPAIGRAPSYGSMSAASSQYQLPPVPSSLLHDSTPPGSPRARSPPTTPMISSTLPHGVAFQALQHQKQAPDPLVTQLESVAIEKLREYRAQADAEILDLVRKKRAHLESLERDAKEQAEMLLALVKNAATANKTVPTRFSLSPLKEPGRVSNAAANVVGSSKGHARHDSLSPTNIPSIPGAENVSSSGSYEDDVLPASAFQRRRPSLLPHKDSASATTIKTTGTAGSAASGAPINGANASHHYPAGNTFSSSLSALSASFAMRGRDLPQMEAWANKRRMRERYPEGDHSAINSADPSGDESELTEEDEEVQKEEDARGRGRDRGRGSGGNGRGSEANESNITIRGAEPSSKPTPIGQRPSTSHAAPPSNVAPFRRAGGTSEREQEEQRQRDVTPSGRGRTAMRTDISSAAAAAPTSMALSSSKIAPSVLVDRQSSSDLNAESAGGIASGDLSGNVREGAAHAEASRTLREADANLAASTTSGSITSGSSLGALGSALGLSTASGTSKNSRKSKKKRVAFADHAVRVSGTPVEAESDSEDEDDEQLTAHKVLLDERDAAVFDIDEDVDGASDDDGPQDADTVGEMNALVLDPEALGLDAAPGDEDSDDDDISTSKVTSSVASVGSLSALAASQSRHPLRAMDAANFDPASLRLDGRIANVPTSLREDLPERYTQPSTSLRPEERSMSGSVSISKTRAPVTFADTEAMLTGLLAPQAPSHRGLWSKGGDKSRKQHKYQLDEEDDEKWAAWKSRAKAPAPSALNKDLPIAHSLPHDGRGLAVPSPRTRAAMALPFVFAEQGPGFAPHQPTVGAFERSGFEREPKTSLPYGEKMLVPSLLQAIRKDRAGRDGTSRLSPISSSQSSGLATGVLAPSHVMSGGSKPPVQGALPSSVTQRGFITSGEQAAGAPSATSPNVSSARPDSATLAVLKRLPRKRSQPYIPPPQPMSSDTVLQADPANVPVPLNLFVVPADSDFAEREEDAEVAGREGDEEGGADKEREALKRELEWMHRVGQLKVKKRTGWKHHRVRDPESIADHMYRMAMLAMLCPSTDVDIGRCVMLALVHDLAEAEVGDLTPLDGVPKEEKVRREKEAIEHHVHDLLGDSPAARRIMALWLEYEERLTKESRLVKDLDRFELCLQALEYERSDDIIDLQPFWRTSIGYISHPRQRKWAELLALERQDLWRSRGIDYTQVLPSEAGEHLSRKV